MGKVLVIFNPQKLLALVFLEFGPNYFTILLKDCSDKTGNEYK